MSRFSPTVSVNAGAEISGLADHLARSLELRAARQRDQALDAERQEDRAAREAEANERRSLLDIELAQGGIYRGTAPADEPYRPGRFDFPEFEAPEFGQSARMGIGARSTPEGGPSLADGIASRIGPAPEPVVKALPGQLIPGMGFTQRAIFSAPAAPPAAAMAPARSGYTPPQGARTHRQLTDNFYQVVEETPEYQSSLAEQMELRRKQDEARALNEGRVNAAIAGGMEPEQARMLEYFDFDDVREMNEPQAPVRGTPEWYDMLTREAEIEARFRPPTREPASERWSMQEALEYVQDRYSEQDANGQWRFLLTPAQEQEYAQRLIDGLPLPDLPGTAAPELGVEAPEEDEGPGPLRRLGSFIAERFGTGRGQGDSGEDEFTQDIEDALMEGRSPALILRDMQSQGVPDSLLQRARQYLDSRR